MGSDYYDKEFTNVSLIAENKTHKLFKCDIDERLPMQQYEVLKEKFPDADIKRMDIFSNSFFVVDKD